VTADRPGPEDRLPSQLRVLHVTPYFAPAFAYGGPPRSVLGLCRGLVRAGVGVEVLTTTANPGHELPPSPGAGVQYDGIRVHYVPRAFPRRWFRAVKFRTRLRARLRDVDLVHIHGLWNVPGWIAADEARRTRTPYVISPRGMLDDEARRRHAWRKLLAYACIERRSVRSAALLHATSAQERATLVKLGVPVVMISNGVDIVEAAPGARGRCRSRLGIPADAPLVTFLGRIHPMKRLDLLAQAFRRVHDRYPDAHLVIAGPDEDGHGAEIQPLFAELGAAVHWTGELTDDGKAALLADADVLVMCSDSESFGMSVAEALAAAVPVVVTQTCPWRKVAEANCGFWVPQTADAVADAVGWLIAHPQEARAMGRRGRELVRAEHDWNTIADAMTREYRRICAGGPRHTERAVQTLVVTPALGDGDGVSVVSAQVVAAIRRMVDESSLEVLALADSSMDVQGARIRRAAGSRLRFIGWALRASLGRRPDVVVVLHAHLAPAVLPLRYRGSKLVVFLHGIEAWRPLRGLRGVALRRADALVANSHHTVRRFRDANPSSARCEVQVCHLGVPAAELSEAPPVVPPDSFALIVGRMAGEERYKGHDLLLDIWPAVMSNAPNARLVIVGDGDDRQRLETRARERGVTENVTFLGRVSRDVLTTLYRDCAFYVMPSAEEGFGLVFLEAMRAGKACIAGAGAAAEIVQDGVTGVIVDPRAPADVLAAVVRLFREPDTRKAMGKAAEVRFHAHFSAAHFQERLLTALGLQGRVPVCAE